MIDDRRPIKSGNKPKRNYKASEYEPSGMDICGTPAYAIEPLLPFIPQEWAIWESACGSGRMVCAFEEKGYSVLGTDITNGPEQNFFDITCEGADCQITNPPYGIKFQWIERSYEIGLPFALLLPVEAIGSKRAQASMKKYGCELLLLNRRVDFFMHDLWNGGSAQFPVLWFCWQLLPQQIIYGDLIKPRDEKFYAPIGQEYDV